MSLMAIAGVDAIFAQYFPQELKNNVKTVNSQNILKISKDHHSLKKLLKRFYKINRKTIGDYCSLLFEIIVWILHVVAFNLFVVWFSYAAFGTIIAFQYRGIKN